MAGDVQQENLEIELDLASTSSTATATEVRAGADVQQGNTEIELDLATSSTVTATEVRAGADDDVGYPAKASEGPKCARRCGGRQCCLRALSVFAAWRVYHLVTLFPLRVTPYSVCVVAIHVAFCVACFLGIYAYRKLLVRPMLLFVASMVALAGFWLARGVYDQVTMAGTLDGLIDGMDVPDALKAEFRRSVLMSLWIGYTIEILVLVAVVWIAYSYLRRVRLNNDPSAHSGGSPSA